MDSTTVKKQLNRKKNRIRILMLCIFAAVIILADLFLIFDHGKTFSERENRMLQQAPPLTGSSLVSGKFMTDAEDFISDQFFFRDGWISYKLAADKLLGRRESNGVYLGKNGYLIENVSAVLESNFQNNLDAIAAFADRHTFDCNIVMTVVPNAVSVLSHLLPDGAPAGDQQEIIRRICSTVDTHLQYIDLWEPLSAHKDEYIYYKSDHHWTTLGARYGFEAMAPSLKLEEPEPAYIEYKVTDEFSGTLASRSGAADVKDTIYINVPDSDLEYVSEYVGQGIKKATMYDSAALETNSKYEVFFGGNFPLIKIRTTVDNKRNLLLIKDSYANAFMQFLLPYYGNIYIVDPRYYSDDIDSLITTGEITDILILYNVNTFVEDNSIAAALSNE